MNANEARKRLLVLESELNRARLVADLSEASREVRSVPGRFRSLARIVTALGVFAEGGLASSAGIREDPGGGPTWLRRLLKGGDLISMLWRAFRPPGGVRMETPGRPGKGN